MIFCTPYAILVSKEIGFVRIKYHNRRGELRPPANAIFRHYANVFVVPIAEAYSVAKFDGVNSSSVRANGRSGEQI